MFSQIENWWLDFFFKIRRSEHLAEWLFVAITSRTLTPNSCKPPTMNAAERAAGDAARAATVTSTTFVVPKP